MDDKRRLLEIFVLPVCEGCRAAEMLADRVRAAALPGVDVRVIDLSEPDAGKPAGVFAVPTYVLDGRVLSKGNPDPAWLFDQLTSPARIGPAREGAADGTIARIDA